MCQPLIEGSGMELGGSIFEEVNMDLTVIRY